MIDTHNKLIFALDVPTVIEAKELVHQVKDNVHFFKVGLELFSARDSYRMIEWLVEQEKKVFVDLKMFDIPETVYRAVMNLRDCGATFTTVHGCNDDVVEAAVDATGASDLGILAVTVLTSQKDGMESQLVTRYARKAKDIGAVGVIASGLEVAHIKEKCGKDFTVVCPGIRDLNADMGDQKRVVTVEKAIENGADYLVVGRPIRDAEDPQLAAIYIQNRIFDAVQEL